ncbi:DsbA family protein [Hyphomonas sp. FCG-A18]|uniref:2-hydroxychromene-2-carboxylate isomerase n=1 Tax=Hyphomonas sp. FCG-A18 TaxID=3080019 RepID=UPI002B31BDD2|nr:DsbA family protein [Hyphomonas sp. FCG-A18]
MKTVDVFWSFRSPYSYLATKRLRALSDKWDVRVRPRPVYPLAIRTPDFFAGIRPQWVPYLMSDVVRLSQYLGLSLGPLNPDPVTMNMMTREIADEQPHIHRLTRLGILACEVSDQAGWAFMDEVSSVIWSGQAWTEGNVLADAVARAGLELRELDARQDSESERLTKVIEANQTEQDKYHWGVPLMVLEQEAFFGQDRIDLLEWRLEQAGVKRR